ncbi:MAG: hypothetical protein LBE04_03240 [Prevotellaceae bacterium]|jgi:hypothetical protein|nr:hypothetical protein [Prevotellaceae bacterium]
MKLLMFFIFVFFSVLTYAQENYIFPEFVAGEIYYKESATAASINYNLFLSDILALDGKKKKRLANVDKIEYVSAGIKRFVPLNDNTFGEILIDGGLVLAVKYSGNVVKTSENGKSITKISLNKLLDSGRPLPDGIAITVDSVYYFVKQRDTQKMFYLPGTNITKATHAGIVRLFAKNKSEINTFIESNKTDFSSFESLKKLVEFCEQYTD